MKAGDMVKAKYANDNAGFGVVLAVDVKIPFRTGQTRILWSDGVVLMADKGYMEVINESR
jgi:hypothetical protein|tara:strand:+ start:325 stop:504 length:180 start_codon:yes stop_codon:yes gene_type:complete